MSRTVIFHSKIFQTLDNFFSNHKRLLILITERSIDFLPGWHFATIFFSYFLCSNVVLNRLYHFGDKTWTFTNSSMYICKDIFILSFFKCAKCFIHVLLILNDDVFYILIKKTKKKTLHLSFFYPSLKRSILTYIVHDTCSLAVSVVCRHVAC